MQRPPFYGMPYINPPMGYHPIGKMTNSQDPKAKAARVFVGNLNTGMVKEQELISIFSKYGVIAAVSLMRGYGFIQYTNEYHARKAVNAEHGHVLGFQPIDLRVANDPNPTRPKGYKRVTQQFGFQPYVDPKVLPIYPGSGRQPYQQMQNKNMTDQTHHEPISGDEPVSWICAFCQGESPSAWELMKHATVSHQTQIYLTNQEYQQTNMEQWKELTQ